MTTEQIESFNRYEELKVEIREKEAELKSLKPIIIPLIEEGQQIQGKQGYFEIRSRVSWKYSKAVSELQKNEKAKGIAEKNEITSLYYVDSSI